MNPGDHHVDHILEELSRLEPDPAATQAALARARRVLVAEASDQAAPRPRPALWRRLARPTSIAASLLLAATLLVGLLLLGPPSVSAAQQLELVTQRTLAYRGWIRVRETRGGTWLDRTVEAVHEGVRHVNPADGTSILDRRIAGHRTIKADFPRRRETATYDGQTNELRLGTLDRITAGQLRLGYRGRHVDLHAWLKQTLDRGPYIKVALHQEEDQLRLEVTYPPAGDQGTRPARAQPRRLVIWADPQTKLAQRIRSTFADGHWRDITLTYGEPIRDLHALDMPHDVRVVDNRLSREIEMLLDRLQRHDRALGDHTAVLLKRAIDDQGQVQPPHSIRLMARRGAAWAGFDYALPPDAWPENWQAATVADWLAVLRQVAPSHLVVYDGRQAWRGNLASRQPPVRPYDPALMPALELTTWNWRTGGWIWPTAGELGLFGTDREHQRVRLVEDEDRPGQVGLRVEIDRVEWVGPIPLSIQRNSETWWLDTDRDDVPMARNASHTGLLVGQRHEIDRTQAEYLDHARTAGGTWYPSRWRTTSEHEDAMRGRTRRQTTEHRLLVDTNLILEPRWFDDPRERW